MSTILIYIAVIALGFFLSKRGYISKSIEKRTGKLQAYSPEVIVSSMVPNTGYPSDNCF